MLTLASGLFGRSILASDSETELRTCLCVGAYRCASTELGRITGAVGVEELLDVIFKDFCIGK